MLKKTLTLVVAIVFLFTFAGFAQNNATVTQTSNDNEVYVEQSGSGNDIVLDQVAANVNDAEMYQLGNNNDLLVIQRAGSYNDIYTWQDGSGNGIDIYQDPYGATGVIYVGQDGDDNGVRIKQRGGNAEIYVDQVGTGNQILTGVGATDPPNPTITPNAIMRVEQRTYTTTGFNSMNLDQYGNNNTLGLYQESWDVNVLDSYQGGNSNEILLWQGTNASRNDAYIDQYGGDNSVKAYQFSDSDNNYVDVAQNGGMNSLFSFQTASNGYNDLNVSQSGGASATVLQIATSGNNIANITQ